MIPPLSHQSRHSVLRRVAGPAAACALLLWFALPVAGRAQPASKAADAARQPAASTSVFDLGAVVDVRRPDPQGLRVMAVTPGGAADRIGLRSGDRLLAVNGYPLNEAERPAAALADALQASHGALQLRITRQGEPVTLSGNAQIRQTQTGGQCGQVTGQLDADLAARDDVLQVDITQIEGSGAASGATVAHALPPGRRVVIIREHVPPATQRSRVLASYASKAMVLDVRPDTLYILGGERDSMLHDSPHWRPVVLRSMPQACR